MPALESLRDALPAGRVVIDHRERPGEAIEAARAIRLARRPETRIRVSGGFRLPWALPDTPSVLREVGAAFGADFCLWGTDWIFLRSWPSPTPLAPSPSGPRLRSGSRRRVTGCGRRLGEIILDARGDSPRAFPGGAPGLPVHEGAGSTTRFRIGAARGSTGWPRARPGAGADPAGTVEGRAVSTPGSRTAGSGLSPDRPVAADRRSRGWSLGSRRSPPVPSRSTVTWRATVPRRNPVHQMPGRTTEPRVATGRTGEAIHPGPTAIRVVTVTAPPHVRVISGRCGLDLQPPRR